MKKIKYLDFPREYRERKSAYINAFDRVMKKGFYVLGGEVHNFESEFAKYLGSKYCVGVANGLEALQISLMALGVGNGDEVITTPLSAVATTLAIMAVGAKPVFIDTNEQGQINTNFVEKMITKKTKALLPVHLYGQPSDIDKMRAICKKYKLYLIEDAAQAHGTFYKGKKLGSFGNVGCFSFYPTKNLGAFGDGGAIVTDSSKVAEVCRQIRDYGQASKYRHVKYGLNSRLDELQAALLRVKLKHLDEDNEKRRRIAQRYISNFSRTPYIKVVRSKNLNDLNFHLFVIRVKKRDALKEHLGKRDIPTLIHYPLTIPQQPFLKKIKFEKQNLSVSERFVKEILSLPCHPHMNLKEVDYISEKIVSFYS